MFGLDFNVRLLSFILYLGFFLKVLFRAVVRFCEISLVCAWTTEQCFVQQKNVVTHSRLFFAGPEVNYISS